MPPITSVEEGLLDLGSGNKTCLFRDYLSFMFSLGSGGESSLSSDYVRVVSFVGLRVTTFDCLCNLSFYLLMFNIDG